MRWLRVMADDAWLGDQHTNVGRLGAAQDMNAAMPRTVAAFMTLCNGRVGAADALRWALVNEVVPRDGLIAAAERYAEMICQSSPLAVQAAVRLYRLASQFPQSLEAYARHLDQEIAETEDGAEGARAFREKRRPAWALR